LLSKHFETIAQPSTYLSVTSLLRNRSKFLDDSHAFMAGLGPAIHVFAHDVA
jgi:hypothetical protein